MNVCVVSALPASLGRAQDLAADLTGRGYRTVLVCLFPLGNRRFSAPGAVLVSPNTFDQRVNRFLNRSRKAWQEPLAEKVGAGWKVLRAAEWRTFRAVRFAANRTALHGENMILGARGLVVKDDSRRLIELLPQGPSAYAVIHAVDPRAMIACEEAARLGGAKLFGPATEVGGVDYEQVALNWLKV